MVISLGLEPLLDVAGAIADVASDPIAGGSLVLVAPSVDRGDGNAKKGGEIVDAEQRFAGFAPRAVRGSSSCRRWRREPP